MSKNGVWQLTRVILQYCDIGGSSRGVRELIQSGRLAQFAMKNPQIQFITVVRRGRHPHLKAKYENGREFAQGCKNENPTELERRLFNLRNRWGHKPRKLGKYVVDSKRPSIQGQWNWLLFHKFQTPVGFSMGEESSTQSTENQAKQE